ncbi:MAG: glycosyltransferase family 9 protein [Chlamydiota bacterium]
MDSPKGILIVKTSAIGDVIQTFPVLQYLRRRFPNAQIDWVAEKGIVPLLRAHPEISKVIPIDTKTWRKNPFSRETREAFSAFKENMRLTTYDVLFDLQGNSKSAVVTHTAHAHVKVGFDRSCVKESINLLATRKRFSVPLEINVRERYLRLVQQYFEDQETFAFQGVKLQLNAEEQTRLHSFALSSGPTLMVCFGSKWENKKLPESAWLGVLKSARDSFGASFLFIYGDEGEKLTAAALSSHFPDCSQCVGELTLPLWQALMWQVDAVLAVDSAALHLCGTTLTPSFSAFGPSLAHIYKPTEERHGVFQGSCPYNVSFATRCPKLRTCQTGSCLRDVDRAALSAAFQEWVARILIPVN